MAHKGLNWKVHFRRDFNLNASNNNTGMPDAWRGFVRLASGGFNLPFWVENPILLQPTEEQSGDTLFWQSPLASHGGFNLQVELKITIAEMFDNYPRAYLNVLDGGGAVRSFFQCHRGSPFNATVSQGNPFLTEALFTDSSFFGFPKLYGDFALGAATWTHWPL